MGADPPAKAQNNGPDPTGRLPRLAAALPHEQARHWFLGLYHSADQLPTVAASWTLQGKLAPAALEWALTAKISGLELPCQHIGQHEGLVHIEAAASMPPLPLLDLSAIAVSARGPRVDSLVAAARIVFLSSERHTYFALLFRLEPSLHLLHLEFLSIAADPQSLEWLMPEVGRLYAERLSGGAVLVQEWTHSYYQKVPSHQYLQTVWGKQVLGWWARQLGNAPPTLCLRGQNPRPVLLRTDAQRFQLVLSERLASAAGQSASRYGVPVRQVYMSAFAVLLRAYGGQSEYRLGLFARGQPSNQNTVGPFESLLPLRMVLTGNPRFSAILGQIELVLREALDATQLPFALLAQEFQRERLFDREALCTIAFGCQPAAAPWSLGPATNKPFLLGQTRTRLDLELRVTTDSRFVVLTYNTALYAQSWARHFLGDWLRILELAVSHPEAKLESLLSQLTFEDVAPLEEIAPKPEKPSLTPPIRDWVELELMLCIQECLKVQPASAHVSLFELGVNSLQLPPFVHRLRQVFAVTLSLAEAMPCLSVHGLARLLRERLFGTSLRLQLSGTHLGQRLPLTPQQKRLWFLQFLKGENPAFHHSVTLEVRGGLRPELIECALARIHQAQPILRANFVRRDGLPVAVVTEDPLILPTHDLTHLPINLARERSEEILADRMRRHLTGEGCLPLRASAIRLEEDRWLIQIVLHRLAGDETSLHLILGQAITDYAKKSAEQTVPAAHLTFFDYAHWQRGAGNRSLQDQLAYWVAQLGGLPFEHGLALDHPRPTIPSMDADCIEFSVPHEVADRLHRLCFAQGVSLGIALQAVFAMLIARYAGQHLVGLASVVTMRHHSDLETMIGPIANRVILRHDFSERPDFATFLRQTRLTNLQAYENGDVPFEAVVEALAPPRDMCREPLCQILFDCHMHRSPPPCAELELVFKHEPLLAMLYDLALRITVTTASLDCRLAYSTDLFEEHTIAHMVRHFLRLLASSVTTPNTSTDTLAIHEEHELAAMLSVWNGDTRAYAQPLLPAAAIRRMCLEQPGHSAVVDLIRGERLNYRQLVLRAESLARRFSILGIRPGQVVALHARPGCEWAVAVVACTFAGACLLPIEWDLRERMVVRMLDAAHARLLLVDRDTNWTRPVAVPVVHLEQPLENEVWDDCDDDFSGELPALLGFDTDGHGHLCGASLSLRAIGLFFEAATTRLALNRRSRLLLAHPRWNDVLVFPLLPLCQGAALYLTPPQSALGNLMELHSFTHCITNPELAEDLLDAEVQLLLDDDFLTHEFRLEAALRQCRPLLWHKGFVTCTWWATRLLIGDDPSVPWQEEAAGTILSHKRAYILDHFGAPIPTGGAGELYLGGEALTPGYWARPALTAQRFLPDTYSAAVGQRLYRTRMRARFAPDGQIVLLHPCDDRVKHNGRWLDLGDLHAILGAHPDIIASAIGQPLGGVLPVFLSCVEGHTLDAEALEHYCAERFLTPVAQLELFPLERLPRDRAGKPILPKRIEDLEALRSHVDAPRNREEAELQHIFAEILQLGNLGIYDDFFQMGGHSFLVIRALELIRKRLGHRLPARVFFETPRVADLARRLADYGGQIQTLPPFPTAAAHYPLSQTQLLLYKRQQLGLAVPPLGQVLHFYGPLRVAGFEHALAQVVARHHVLSARCTHQGDDIWLIGKECNPPFSLIDLNRLTSKAAAELERALIGRACRTPFALERGPLWRAVLLRHDPWATTLVIALHPLICDRVSVNVLLGDLARCYSAEREMRPALFPHEDVQFADFVAWRRSDEQLLAQMPQLDYWRHHLNGMVPLQLPTDRPRRAERNRALIGQYRRAFARNLELALEDLSHRQGTTLFAALQATFAALLGRMAGTGDVTLLTPVCLRTHHDLSYLIGQFTHLVPLRNNLRGRPDLLTLLRRTRLLTQKAFANADVDFEQVLGKSQLNQLQSGSALTFELVYGPRLHTAFPDLETVAEPLPALPAGCDLSLCLRRAETELVLELDYDSELFESGTIQRLAAAYLQLIESCLANPEQAVASVELFDEIQREFLLRAWSGQGHDTSQITSFQERFLAVVEQRPDHSALELVGETNIGWTYAELAGSAWKLAERLSLLGQNCERVIGILMPRSPEWVVAVLGASLAGVPFVLLDPDWPGAHNAMLLREVDAELVLVSHKNRLALAHTLVETVLVESRASGQPLARELPTASMAFLMPTAAAFGRTTMTMIPQSALSHLLVGLHSAVGSSRGRRHLLTTPICLGMTLPQVFWPLAEGATLVLANLADADAELLDHTLNRQAIDVWAATPSFWQAMLSTGWRPHERLIALSSGEHLADVVAEPLVRYAHQLFNMYGTSEVLVWASARRIQRDQGLHAALGGVLAGHELFLVDPELNLISIGEVGEICLGGHCLSRGYWDQPALTALAFVPHPFAEKPGARLFRTGDLAHWRNDGSLALLRRLDRQIKLGGYRVDPAEVEAALALHPAIIRSAVVIHGQRHRRYRLTAFVDCAGSLPPEPRALRAFLEQYLPNHMIPSSFRFITLPLTAAGELDLGLLNEMLDHDQERGDVTQENRTPMQRILAVIIREVFQCEADDMEEVLFHQAQDHARLEELIAGIRDLVDQELTVKHLLERPTIAALAAYLEGLQP